MVRDAHRGSDVITQKYRGKKTPILYATKASHCLLQSLEKAGLTEWVSLDGFRTIKSNMKAWLLNYKQNPAWEKRALELTDGKGVDFQFEVVETFQNEDGSRVASRWRVTGKNNGVLGNRS